ncbi:MAG: GerMN domain-containing protein [Firmicutes bacterium]|jgi:germination protein M|nr:GerMN domain-containing protein [Bacillota bacterium]
MGRERRIALVIVVLLAVSGGRLLFKTKDIPAFRQESGSVFAVYFASSTQIMLEPEFYWGEPSLRDLAQLLVAGPADDDLLAILPPQTVIRDVYRRDDVAYVDFSRHLVTNHPGGTSGELVTIYGIVNTFASLPGIERVQIMVEGRPVESLAGHVYTGEPLYPDYSLAGAWLI